MVDEWRAGSIDAAAGFAAGVACTLAFQPLDTVLTRQQYNVVEGRSAGAAALVLLKQGGGPAFWRGTAPLVALVPLQNALLMIGYGAGERWGGAEEADGVVHLIDVQAELAVGEAQGSPADKRAVIDVQTIIDGLKASGRQAILALNKIDAVPYVSSPVSEEEVSDAGELENWTKRAGVPEDVVASFDAIVATSATTRFGLSDLEEALASIIGASSVNAEGAQWAANQRQAEALRCACAALDRLTETIEHGLPVDFWTIELREAAAALGEITGEDVAEDVLDVVFTKFCIGK